MPKLIKPLLILMALVCVGLLSYRPALNYWKLRNQPSWLTARVVRGDAVRMINSTGTVQPVLSVSIGSFVSGPIVELNVDFNDEVREGDLLARIDPRLFAANVARDKAVLATREAELARIKSDLQQAQNDLRRGESLQLSNQNFMSEFEMDTLRFACQGLAAQVQSAEAGIMQAQASLENSQANFEYTEIRSPVDGIVIDRKIDPGQTLAAQFQTPELFIIAPDLQKQVHVLASVDEADIGLLLRAQKEERPVTFTVDAYPDELFYGEIEQIRLSSVNVQNVVTYPVIVTATNYERKLLPGMTASLSFDVESVADVVKIPNAALRFYPEDMNYVAPEDHALLDGSRWKSQDAAHAGGMTAEEKTAAQRLKNTRHVWVVEEGMLHAVEVTTGLTENSYSVLVSGSLEAGAELVTALETK
ncbi:efflux RND transporter periplasmic adaptor subunit [Aureliella helgolandensis]|nr:efflux RND transporter periplasmic adaptor subunit [Aureliella helgolandensis]